MYYAVVLKRTPMTSDLIDLFAFVASHCLQEEVMYARKPLMQLHQLHPAPCDTPIFHAQRPTRCCHTEHYRRVRQTDYYP